MIRRVLFVVLSVKAFVASALAGEIQGNVSGATGTSVVYVDAIPGKTFPPPAQHFQIDQKGRMFQPHVLVITVGATVDFQNSDSVQHNLFWPSINGNKKLGHNLGTWPKGEKRSFQFDQPGAIPLLCNVHPEMSGYLVVSPTPYFAETNGGGNFKISNVPDGKYTVAAWHEGAKPQSKPVDVSGTVKVEFSLSK
jgi:plastocyanin